MLYVLYVAQRQDMYAIMTGLLGRSGMCCHVAMYEGVILSGEHATSIFKLHEQLSHSNGGPIIGFQLCSAMLNVILNSDI